MLSAIIIMTELAGCGKGSGSGSVSIPDNITDTTLLYEIGNVTKYPSTKKEYEETEIQDGAVEDILEKKSINLDYDFVGVIKYDSYTYNHTVYKVNTDLDYDVWLLCWLNYAYTDSEKTKIL
jgi:hypothetical protein